MSARRPDCLALKQRETFQQRSTTGVYTFEFWHKTANTIEYYMSELWYMAFYDSEIPVKLSGDNYNELIWLVALIKR